MCLAICGILLTTLNHHGTDLCIMRIRFKFHGTRQHQRQLGHIEQRLVMVKPEIMIGYAHLVEGDLFGILKETIGTPNAVQPVHVENAILLAHVLWQTQTRIAPTLC